VAVRVDDDSLRPCLRRVTAEYRFVFVFRPPRRDANERTTLSRTGRRPAQGARVVTVCRPVVAKPARDASTRGVEKPFWTLPTRISIRATTTLLFYCFLCPGGLVQEVQPRRVRRYARASPTMYTRDVCINLLRPPSLRTVIIIIIIIMLSLLSLA